MISNLSKVATLYLTTVLSLTSLILILFAYTAPTIILHSRVALLVVSPSLELTNSSSSRGIDGPTVFLGALGKSHLHNPNGKGSDCPATGSCSRPNNKGPVTCTPSSVSPTYGTLTWTSTPWKGINDDIDLSALPSNSPDLLTAPTATTPVFIAMSIALSTIFFILFTLISLRASLGAKLSALLDKPALHRASAWLGLLGFMIGKSPRFLGGLILDSNRVLGLTSFLVIRMWFGKAVEDFNRAIIEGGTNAPQLIAQLSNGFTSTCSCSA